MIERLMDSGYKIKEKPNSKHTCDGGASLGALNIHDTNELYEGMKTDKDLSFALAKIGKQAQLIYAGEDEITGVKGGELTKGLERLTGILSRDHVKIIKGANHLFNDKKRYSHNFNSDGKFPEVSEIITKYFEGKLKGNRNRY